MVEPDDPYFKGTDNHGVSDNKSSLYGPAPGFIPGGPNPYYGSPGTCTWRINENSISVQGPYVALGAYFMG